MYVEICDDIIELVSLVSNDNVEISYPIREVFEKPSLYTLSNGKVRVRLGLASARELLADLTIAISKLEEREK